MIYEKKKLHIFTSLRILHQGEDVLAILHEKKPDRLAVVSYKPLPLEEHGFTVKHKRVANLYLSGTIDDVFGTFSVSTRNEINKTFKMPDLEIRVRDNNREEAYHIYSAFEKLQGRKPWSRDTFDKNLYFNAYYKGKLIVTIPCYDLSPYLQIRSISSIRMDPKIDKELYRIVGYATRRLIYEAAKYGIEHGYTFVGLGAISEATVQKKNVSQFKMFFAPRVEDEYTYVYQSKRFQLLNRFHQLFR